MGKFEIFIRDDDRFHFNLKAPNGQVILTSQGYKQKSGVENGVQSVKNHAADPANFDVFEAKDGRCYFNLKAANGQVVGTSQMYKSFDAMNKGIASVQANAPEAEIVDQTV